MKRLLWVAILVTLAGFPAAAADPEEVLPTTAVTAPATSTGLGYPYDLYGSFWFPGIQEAEWSPFMIPTGPMNFWDAYTWGFVRFRYWFDAQRYGWCWPPNFSPLGWGWDGWYGGWYGWTPDGVPAGMGMGTGWGFYSPVVRPLQVSPVRPVAPRPIVHRPPGASKKGWFGGAVRPARPDEVYSSDPDAWSRSGLSSGMGEPGSTRKSGGSTRPSMAPRPSPRPAMTRPTPRRR